MRADRNASAVEDQLPLKPQWFHILLALSEETRHGSGIVRSVLRQTDGKLRLWPATLYGSLDDLAAKGWIEELRAPESRPPVRARRSASIASHPEASGFWLQKPTGFNPWRAPRWTGSPRATSPHDLSRRSLGLSPRAPAPALRIQAGPRAGGLQPRGGGRVLRPPLPARVGRPRCRVGIDDRRAGLHALRGPPEQRRHPGLRAADGGGHGVPVLFRRGGILRGPSATRCAPAASSTAATGRTQRKSLIVNEAFAAYFWPGENSLGKLVTVARGWTRRSSASRRTRNTVR